MMALGEFDILYPPVLLLLIVIPLLTVFFLLKQRQYWQDAFAFSQIAVLQRIKQEPNIVWHQRVVPAILLLSLTFGIIGLSSPELVRRVATKNSFLMLVMDISISMEATDLSPNRLHAAKTAAIDFVKDLPDGVQIGLAFFAGNTYLVSPPTEDHRLLVSYLKSLEMEDLRPGTAIGDAMLMAIQSLENRISQTKEEPVGTREMSQPLGSIILLTDGESNLGISPIVATEEAVNKQIKVFPIGIGEETGAYVRGGIFTHLDETSLMTIAQQTGGQYYRARALKDFKDIYGKIGQKTLHIEEKRIPLMPVFLGLSMLCVLSAFVWGIHHRRI